MAENNKESNKEEASNKTPSIPLNQTPPAPTRVLMCTNYYEKNTNNNKHKIFFKYNDDSADNENTPPEKKDDV